MARHFSGGVSTDVIRVPQYAAYNNLTTLSVSWWANIASDGGGSNGRIADKIGNFNLFTTGGVYTFLGLYWTTDGRWTWPRTNSVWQHVVFTYDHGDVANNPIVYVNGSTVTVTRTTAPVAPLINASNPMDIGNAATANRALDGDLAELAIWNRVLNSTEAASVYNSGAGSVTSGRVLYTPLCGVASPEPNVDDGANNGAVTGTTFSAHPAIAGGGCTSAVLSGTALAGINEADIVAGGKQIVITLTGTTWIT